MISDLKNYPKIFFEQKEIDKSQILHGDILIKIDEFYLNCDLSEEALGVIVISNTCDIINDKINYLLVSPIYPMKTLIDKILKELNNPPLPIKLKNKRNTLIDKMGSIINYKHKTAFFIPQNHVFKKFSAFASLEEIYFIKMDDIEEIKKYKKLSLMSPYIESLAYKTGNLFNRISLETLEKSKVSNYIIDHFSDMNLIN